MGCIDYSREGNPSAPENGQSNYMDTDKAINYTKFNDDEEYGNQDFIEAN